MSAGEGEVDPLNNDVVTYTGHVQPPAASSVAAPFNVTITDVLREEFNAWLDRVGAGVASIGPDSAGVEQYALVVKQGR